MDLKELNYVVTVANEGSISRAAEKLFMSQSSLSQAIRVLEQDLGTSVFVRTTRGVRPTAAGDAFISHANISGIPSALYGQRVSQYCFRRWLRS